MGQIHTKNHNLAPLPIMGRASHTFNPDAFSSYNTQEHTQTLFKSYLFYHKLS